MHTNKMIFVFGSNEGGIHGAGAARFALKHRGAIWGQGAGLQGRSYAIPTKMVVAGRPPNTQSRRVGPTLSLQMIKAYVDQFLDFVSLHPELQFQVTAIGCGLAGLKHEEIAPMFMTAPDNCYFDNLWFPYLTIGAGDKPQHKFWGTF